MAQPYTTGPAHLFIGVASRYASVVSLPPLEQRTLTGILFPGGVPNFDIRGKITNITSSPDPQPPSYILSILQSIVPVYLGTAEKSPVIERTPFYVPWYEDGLGSSGCADDLYDGEEHIVAATLNRFDEALVAYIQNATAGVLGGRRGIDRENAVGTSMVWEGAAFPLWVQFPNAAKNVSVAGSLPGGYRYYQAKLISPDRASDMGATPFKRTLAFQCLRYLDLESGVTATYDHDMTGLPVVT